LSRVNVQDAFDQYHRAVFRFAFRLTGSAGAAEDITQECFLALLRAPERFDPARGPLKTYLFAIARNLALSSRRQNWREDALDDSPEAAVSDGSDRLDLAQAVARAVTSLTAPQREVLVLFEYEGFTLEEIGAVVEADVGTVKSRLYRARERLKKVLAPYGRTGVANGTSSE
jgi:RNA polymerase sigma-70 factor (ECF subfamily)